MENEFGQQIGFLVELQEMDIDLDRMEEEYTSIPDEIDACKKEIESRKSEVEENRKQSKELMVEQKNLEIEISSKEEAIKKHKMELNTIKTNEQYKILQAEIARAEQEKSVLEDEYLKLIDIIGEKNKLIAGAEQELKSEEARILASIKELEDKSAALEQEINRKKEERGKYVAVVTETILKKYEHIRKGKDGIAISMIENTHCGSCRINLPPQVINEVSKGAWLVFCDNCSRILYLKTENQGKDEGSL